MRQQPLHVEARGGELGGVEAIGIVGPGLRQADLGHAGPEIGQRGEAEEAQIIGRGRPGLFRVAQAGAGDRGRRLLQARERLAERLDEFAQRRVLVLRLDIVRHGMEKPAQQATGIGGQLAADEVQRLDAVGPLIDLRDATVAYILLHAMFANVTMAAQNLHAEIGGLRAEIGHQRFHDRRQQGDEIPRLPPHFGIRVAALEIKAARRPGRKRAATLGIGALGQQHAPDIRMHDDRIGRLIRMFRARERAALQPLAGIGDGALIGGLGDAKALHADRETLGVHHGEHGAHALPGLADEPAGRPVEIHDAGG